MNNFLFKYTRKLVGGRDLNMDNFYMGPKKAVAVLSPNILHICIYRNEAKIL